jgi:hypothetical protein
MHEFKSKIIIKKEWTLMKLKASLSVGNIENRRFYKAFLMPFQG